MEHYSKTQWRMMKPRRVSKVCEYCDVTVFRFPPADVPMLRSTIDHILPQSRKGSSESYNLKMSCLWCNNGKNAFGECIAALRCAEAIVGRENTYRGFRRITRWWRNIQKAVA